VTTLVFVPRWKAGDRVKYSLPYSSVIQDDVAAYVNIEMEELLL
jgi:hypothetical protein